MKSLLKNGVKLGNISSLQYLSYIMFSYIEKDQLEK